MFRSSFDALSYPRGGSQTVTVILISNTFQSSLLLYCTDYTAIVDMILMSYGIV